MIRAWLPKAVLRTEGAPSSIKYPARTLESVSILGHSRDDGHSIKNYLRGGTFVTYATLVTERYTELTFAGFPGIWGRILEQEPFHELELIEICHRTRLFATGIL